jgi:hypothetical protein
MLPPVNRGALIKRLCAVAALAGAAVCGLEGLPDAAGDGGETPAAAGPELESGPGGVADAGSTPQSRRRIRRWKRMGVPGGPDGGILATRDAGAPRDAGHDLIARGTFVPRAVAPPVVAPPPPPSAPSTPSTSQPVTELGFNTCQKIPRGKRAIKMSLKPDVELPELVAWISSVTCKSFVLPGHLSGGGRKVTIVTQGALTRDEAYAAFLSAIDSIGLTVERHPGYLMIIETSKAKSSSMPVYGFDGEPTRGGSSGSRD